MLRTSQQPLVVAVLTASFSTSTWNVKGPHTVTTSEPSSHRYHTPFSRLQRKATVRYLCGVYAVYDEREGAPMRWMKEQAGHLVSTKRIETYLLLLQLLPGRGRRRLMLRWKNILHIEGPSCGPSSPHLSKNVVAADGEPPSTIDDLRLTHSVSDPKSGFPQEKRAAKKLGTTTTFTQFRDPRSGHFASCFLATSHITSRAGYVCPTATKNDLTWRSTLDIGNQVALLDVFLFFWSTHISLP